MSEVTVRKAVLSDIPYVYEICLKTGDSGKDAAELFNDPYLIGHYYAAPYLIFPDSICFIAESQCRPQGYIIAVPDTIAFNQWLEKDWLPPLRLRYPLQSPQDEVRLKKEKEIIKAIHNTHFPIDTAEQPWLSGYPAHLHIDLLPSLQGKGMGRTLTDTLFDQLKKQGVPGLHLGVGSSNAGAVAFYQKLGFTVLKEETWGFTMGKLCN